jgi:arylsulfatase A-like enzyme
MSTDKNILWVIADQLRGQALGYAGDPNVHTPHLDRFAAEGHTFTRAVAGAPLCCPARGSMLTGRYPRHSGVAGHRHPMPAGTPTVAGELAAAGYRTCWIGKWHLDGDRPELGPEFVGEGYGRTRMIPSDRRGGFQDWWAYENNNRPFDCHVHTDTGRTPPGTTVEADIDGMQQFRLDGYETDALTDLLLAWLRDQRRDRPGQPFFAVLSVQPPHDPYVAPAETMRRHTPGHIELRPNVPPIRHVQERARRDLAGYYAAIERIDHNFGRIRAALSELGIADDTYVIFLSDHGDMHGSHGQWRKTAPWEESIRVPFVIGGPSREHMTAHRLDQQINQVDLAPTTLGLCGLTPPAWMEGADHSPLLHGEHDDLPDSTYIGIPVPTGHSSSIDRPWHGVLTTDGWKYVCLDDDPWLMFNLTEDPYELANHAHDPGYHNKRDQLHHLLMDWASTAG